MSSVSSRTGHPASSNNCAKDQDHWPQLPLDSSQHQTNVPNFEIDLNTTLTYAGLGLNDFNFLLPWPSNEDSFPATALPTETHGQFFAQFQSDLRPTSIGTPWSPRGASGQNAGLAVENSMALSSYQPSHMVFPMGMPTTCGVSTNSGPFPISSAAHSSLQQHFEGSSPSTISELDDSSSSSWPLGSQTISGDTVNTLVESDRTSLKPLLPVTSSQLARMQMPPTELAQSANPKKRNREEAQIQEPSVRAGNVSEGLVLLPSIGTEDQKDRNHKRRRSNESERGAVKACVRCRVYRIKCEGDHGKTCNRCAKSLEKSKIFTQPCLRLSLDDVQAFRAGNSRVGQFRSTLPTYRWSTENSEIRRIRISFQFPPSILTGRDAPSLLVTCREFLPSTEDQLTNTVVSSDGDEITINFPAYACLDAHTTKTQRAMNTFLDCCQPLAEATLDNTIHDDIIKLSLAEARRYAQSRTTIVSRVLKVHYANFLSENHLVIVGPETLGIEAVNNSKFQENGRVLAPWSIDAQMDVLYIAYFRTHMKHVISGLKKLIFSRDDKRETWYEIFLAIFVLLSNLESVHKCQVSYIQRFCKSNGAIFAAANQVKQKMIEEWKQSARNLIYHFRVVIKGTLPFAQTWTEDMQEKAGIDNKSMDYIKRISSMVANRREELLKLCTMDAVEEDPKPLMWIASLFLNS